jgi:hypothetical protein
MVDWAILTKIDSHLIPEESCVPAFPTVFHPSSFPFQFSMPYQTRSRTRQAHDEQTIVLIKALIAKARQLIELHQNR